VQARTRNRSGRRLGPEGCLKTRGGLIGRETSMQRIQYHRYGRPEEMRLENCPPFANMFMIRAPFARPRRHADVARAVDEVIE